MKRTLIVLGLAVVLVFGVVASALAANPPGTYKLTIAVYHDADSDACWDPCETVLPNVKGQVTNLANLTVIADYKTNACGSAYVYVPAGTTVLVDAQHGIEPWPSDLFPELAWISEATPGWSAFWAVASVTMNRNRCVLFGMAPQMYTPPDCTCEPVPCEPCVRPD